MRRPSRPVQMRAITVVVAGIAALLLVLTMGFHVQSSKNGTMAPPPVPSGCATKVHFYADDARPGSHQFGPAIGDLSLSAGVKRFGVKACTDPAFAGVWEDDIVYGFANGAQWEENQAARFIADRSAWREAVKAMLERIQSFSVADSNLSYQTVLMVPEGTSVPLIRQTARPVAMGHVLVIHLKDGRILYARYSCDLQPAQPNLPQPVLPAGPSPRGPPPGRPSPPSSPPTTPKQLKNCNLHDPNAQDDSVTCGTKLSGPDQQPLQEHKPPNRAYGGGVTQTTDSPDPTKPIPPTKGGTNSGSTNGGPLGGNTTTGQTGTPGGTNGSGQGTGASNQPPNSGDAGGPPP